MTTTEMDAPPTAQASNVEEIVNLALGIHYMVRDVCDDLTDLDRDAAKTQERLPRSVQWACGALPAALEAVEELCDLLADEFCVEVLKDPPPYEKWSKRELQERAEERLLPTSGTKVDLIRRLRSFESNMEAMGQDYFESSREISDRVLSGKATKKQLQESVVVLLGMQDTMAPWIFRSPRVA